MMMMAQPPAIDRRRWMRVTRVHTRHTRRDARGHIYIYIYFSRIYHTHRDARVAPPSIHRRTIRSDPRRDIPSPSSIHHPSIHSSILAHIIIRTANKLNASRRLDASAALACTVVFAARVAACARRDLSAARAFSLAVKQEDKVTVDDITSAGMTHWANRAIVQSSTRSRPTPTPTHTVRGRDWWIVRARVSDIRHRRRSSSSSRAIPTRGGGRVCVYPWVHTDTIIIIIIIMHRHSSSSLR